MFGVSEKIVRAILAHACSRKERQVAKKAQNAQNSSPDSIKQYLRRVLVNINDMKHQDGVGKYVYSESARAFQYMHTE